jgi:hypothetical protein
MFYYLVNACPADGLIRRLRYSVASKYGEARASESL